jgi:hypothetical protein
MESPWKQWHAKLLVQNADFLSSISVSIYKKMAEKCRMFT